MDAGLRRRVEAGLGTDLAAVRVHTDPTAGEIARAHDARAFTLGRHIFFARDQYAPRTAEGERRIAHELAHVVQQQRGAAPAPATGGRYDAAEREGRQAAEAALAGRRAGVRERTGGLVQRQGWRERSEHPFTGPGQLQLSTPPPALDLGLLTLDPDIRASMMLTYLHWWLGSGLTTGVPIVPPAFQPSAGPSLAPTLPEGGSTLPPDFFRPIAPDVLGPDMGAIMAPYNLRGVPLGARDVDSALQIYNRSAWWVSLMPDLRDMAPGFIRPLIPGDWRRRVAGAFTAATIDAQLRHDYPTPIEISDQAWRNLTGASTTYIPIPGLSF